MDFIKSFFKAFGLAILGVILFLCLSFFGFVLTIDQTILNRDFTASQIDRLDIASLAEEIINTQVLPRATIRIPSKIEEYIVEAAKETITDLEPWIKQQTREVTYSLYDYLEERSQHLSLVIPLEPVKESLRDNLREAMPEPLPPEFAGYSPELIEGYIDTFYEQIPSAFEFDEDTLSPQVMARLEQLKQVRGLLNTLYLAMISLILLLILLTVLVNRQVRGSTRSLGATFLSCGIVSYGGVWLTKYAIGAQLAQPQAPAYLQTWLPQVLADMLAPMEMYSLGLIGMGIILLVVSFVYRRQAES